MTRTLYTQTKSNRYGDDITITVVRTDDYETREVALDNAPGLVLSPTALLLSVSINDREEIDLAFTRQLDAFTAVVCLFEEYGVCMN